MKTVLHLICASLNFVLDDVIGIRDFGQSVVGEILFYIQEEIKQTKVYTEWVFSISSQYTAGRSCPDSLVVNTCFIP